MHHPVIIVGGGPAGLAMGYRLQQHHIPALILEKERIGHSWHSHYDNLRLHTLKERSHLPGLPLPDAYDEFVPRADFAAYLQQYAQHFDLNVREGVEVTKAQYHPYHAGWHLHTTAGEFTADLLVAATGIWSTPYRPAFTDEEKFTGRIFHANQYKNARPFADRRVLVIGGGNTGTEIATEASATAVYTAIAIRNGTTFVPYPTSASGMDWGARIFRTLPDRIGHHILKRTRRDFSHLGLEPPPGYLTQSYPVVGYELPEAVADGRVTVYPCGIERFTADGVIFENGEPDRFDTVVLATGYRPTLDFLAGELVLKRNGRPCLTSHHQSSENDHLYCVGYDYPSTEGWLQSLPRVTQQAADHIARTLSQKTTAGES